jgi:hypothetical protein
MVTVRRAFESFIITDLNVKHGQRIGKAAFLRGLHLLGLSMLLGPVFKMYVLLLGFQELYARRAWQEERPVWAAVIRLYLVRSVTKILDVLEDAPQTLQRLELLRTRLSTLRCAQRDLEKNFGLAKGEEICATTVSKLAKQGRHNIKPRLEEVAELIIASRGDMSVLWRDEDVRAKLETHGTRIDRL